MGVGERQTQKPQRRKTPSFSSSLLDAMYHSIDEPQDFLLHRRNNAPQVEEEIESLRRAILVEKWMQNYSNATPSATESRSSVLPLKSRAMKMYSDLKKSKDPVSPRGRIASFLNAIFSPRNLKKNQVLQEWNAVRKSRSMKDTSCFNKTPSSATVDRGTSSVPTVGSQFIKKNIDSFRLYEGKKNQRKNEFRNVYENESDVDDKSCASSDLFELESIARIGSGAYEEELPVYGTTNLNQLIM